MRKKSSGKNNRDDSHARSLGSSINSHDDLICVLIFPTYVVVAVVGPLDAPDSDLGRESLVDLFDNAAMLRVIC